MYIPSCNHAVVRRLLGAVLIALTAGMLLSACKDSTSANDSSGNSTAADTSNSIQLTGSAASVPSSGIDAVTVTATVKDENNVLVEGANVTFSSSGGDLSVDPSQSQTDSSGTASAQLGAGTDETDARERMITVTAEVEADGAQAQLDLPVAGTSLAISGPETVRAGETGDFTATLTDSDGAGIPNIDLSATTDSGATVSPASGTTDAQGKVTFSVDGTTAAATDKLTINGLGETASTEFSIASEVFNVKTPDKDAELGVNQDHTVTVHWADSGGPVVGSTVNFNLSRGSFTAGSQAVTDANGDASVTIRSASAGLATVTASAGALQVDRRFRFVGTTPADIAVKSGSSEIATGGQTTITATVTDANGNPVADKYVEFALTQDPSQGGLSTTADRTGADGKAETVFTAGSEISGTDGVEITAQVREDTSINESTLLTVSGTALRVSLGTGNALVQASSTEYSMPWSLVVTNSTGKPADSRDVELAVVPRRYIEGSWVAGADSWIVSRTSPDSPECRNEDTDLDNTIDPGEDRDGDGVLEPDSPVLSKGTVTTDDEGRASFELIYPETESQWVEVTLQARVKNSAGTEFSDKSTFILPALADDTKLDGAPPGGTGISPYGTNGDCLSDPAGAE